MLDFNQIYHPRTAHPFLADHTYMEYQPCRQLKPFVACFWTEAPADPKAIDRSLLVIPDTCMDVIVLINHTRQTITGFLSGMQDQPFIATDTPVTDRISRFAIRFHFWSAHLFFDLDFKTISNKALPLDQLGTEWCHLFSAFFDVTAPRDRIMQAEHFLLGRLNEVSLNANLFNSIGHMLKSCGRAPVADICNYSCVSQRQMERIYQQNIGLSLKRVSSLIRYQNVWQEMTRTPVFDPHQAVLRYGYTDQAHLLNEFKRFHGVNPTEARIIAVNNQ